MLERHRRCIGMAAASQRATDVKLDVRTQWRAFSFEDFCSLGVLPCREQSVAVNDGGVTAIQRVRVLGAEVLQNSDAIGPVAGRVIRLAKVEIHIVAQLTRLPPGLYQGRNRLREFLVESV